MVTSPLVFHSITAQPLPPAPFPQKEHAWHGTDPANHDPSHYRYLVHAVHEATSVAKLTQMIAILKDESGSYDTTEAFDLLMKPHNIAKKALISCSLIDNEHATTFSSGGFILEVSNDHVLDASNTDRGTPFFRGPKEVRERLLARRQRGHLPPAPEAVLSATHPEEYNEVLLTGTVNDRPVKIVGVFIKKDARGNVLEAGLERRLNQLARHYGWPVVYISMPPKASYQADRRIIVSRNETTGELLAFNIQAKRYAFWLTDTENRFSVFEYGGDSRHAMTSDELHFALSYLRQEIEADPAAIEARLTLDVGDDRSDKLEVLSEIMERIAQHQTP